MFQTIPRYEETGLGLPYPVLLIDGAEEEIDAASGARIGISIPNLEDLIAAVALVRVVNPARLDGAEVRFIRQAIGMTATAFADALTLDKATFSRWENNRQTVGEWADKQVRLFVAQAFAGRAPELGIDPRDLIGLRVRDVAPGEWPRIAMRRVASNAAGGWDTLPKAA